MITVYLARAMTGRIKEEVVEEAAEDKKFFEAAGLTVLCPVAEEAVKPTQERLVSSKKQMDIFWKRDKQMIREANVIIDMTPHMNSEGSKHEIGYGRYFLWKPVVRVFPAGKLPFKSSVAFYEDDSIVDSKEYAVEYILRMHGTYMKRLKWRLLLYKRCILKAMYYKLMEWFR